MQFYELLKTRRSIRKYQPKKVEKDIVDKILSAALMSPASKRSNPWEFIVVQDKVLMKKLAESRPHGSQLLAESPLGIVIVADTTKSDVWIEDASIAATIIQLQAHESGLGSCWVQVRERFTHNQKSAEEYIREILNIPTKYAVLCIISIGYAAETKLPFEEEKLETTKIHFEKYQKLKIV
ncbi:MAG TPA: nitroreductase family protein [Paludibacter sp.]|nr:nitroreductase family protein [Paludibacter sp.]